MSADTDGGGDEEPELTEAERAALHDLRLAVEHVHRAYGHLLAFHHEIGHAMDEFADAGDRLRESDHDAFADGIRDELLPAGVVGDRWSYELVESFESGLLADARAFERAVRESLADGADHITERAQQRRWRDEARDPES
jgi:hypothetical protein